MVHRLSMAPLCPALLKCSLPARKSALVKLRLEAAKPLTLTWAPAPNRTRLGLIRRTLPFDCSAPSICEGFCPVMGFNTLLEDFCWMNRVSSPGLIEKFCQLMIVPGELVMNNRLPEARMLA